jgi:hypothetical protein
MGLPLKPQGTVFLIKKCFSRFPLSNLYLYRMKFFDKNFEYKLRPRVLKGNFFQFSS